MQLQFITIMSVSITISDELVLLKKPGLPASGMAVSRSSNDVIGMPLDLSALLSSLITLFSGRVYPEVIKWLLHATIILV